MGQRTSHSEVATARIRRAMGEHRHIVQAALDLLAWFLGLWAAVLLRFEFALDAWPVSSVLTAILLATLLQLGVGVAFGLYTRKWRFGSFDEVAGLIRVVIVVTAVLHLLSVWVYPTQLLPTSVALASGMVVALITAFSRYTWRFYLERSMRPSPDVARKVLVMGAGEAGIQLVTSMLRNRDSGYYPVAMLDDDPLKSHLQVMGVPVIGDREALPHAVRTTGATHLIVSIPSASGALIRDLSNRALSCEIGISVLPRVESLIGGTVGVSDVRPVSERDLLGRHEVRTDVDQIAGYVTGKRVLVTGAGGSIGSELCRQLQRFGPQRVVMLDRDESALHAVQMSIEGRALLDSRNLVVADIRDADRMVEVFTEHRPDVVFHAAALKHLPLLEMYPDEGVKTNVHGTRNLLLAAEGVGVERFVNISTDKAADPSSVLGHTKRVAERLTASVGRRASGTYLSVRFGNVLGSRGSVLEAFRKQISSGGPITVTHPEVTRYFMLAEEAVELVIQAGAIGRDGEALVLDMGDPVRIDDVARRLADEAERDIAIVYTGLRPGEKLHEVLVADAELDHRPAHPLISHVAVPPLDLESTVEDDLQALIELPVSEPGDEAASELPSATRVYLSPPDMTALERRRLLEAFDANWVAPVGPDLTAFEAELAAACGREHAVALSSATAALHLSLLIAGVGRDDIVLVPTLTFVATANAVLQCGATPIFIDSEEDGWGIDPALVDATLARLAAEGRRAKAVIAVDIYGQLADHHRLQMICDRHRVTLVADAAQSLGSRRAGALGGSHGMAAALSFNGNKVITTGGGGALVTDDEAVAERARSLATQSRLPVPHFEHNEPGFNYRMSNLLAAVGRGQLERLPSILARLAEINARYIEALDPIPGLDFMPVPDGSAPNGWLTVMLIDPAVAGCPPEDLRLALESHDIEARAAFKPMHQQPLFRTAEAVCTGVADRVYEHGLCLPSGSSLTDDDQARIIRIIGDMLRRRVHIPLASAPVPSREASVPTPR
ncbi:MAG: aminotransferase class I/II-fold pyridoxal phosphate-dependent enzyme [Actinomycetota bacterium]